MSTLGGAILRSTLLPGLGFGDLHASWALRNQFMDWLLRGASWPARGLPAGSGPSFTYVAAFRDPGGLGTPTEVVGNNYARVPIPSAPESWTYPCYGRCFSLAPISRPSTGPWGTIVSLAVFDSPTGGNKLFGHSGYTVELTIDANSDYPKWMYVYADFFTSEPFPR